MIASAPMLTIYRVLDGGKLSPEFIAHVQKDEKAADPTFVENDRPRDYLWSDEIVAATRSFALVDQNGNRVAEFPTLTEVEAARASATITFGVTVGGKEVTAAAAKTAKE